MKRKRIIKQCLLALSLLTCVACGSENNDNVNSEKTEESRKDSTTAKDTTTNKETETNKDTTTKDSDSEDIEKNKNSAMTTLDYLIVDSINKVSEDDLNKLIVEFYNNEKLYIQNVTDLETSKTLSTKITNDTNNFIINKLKPALIKKLDNIINPLVDAITNEELKNKVSSYYKTKKDTLDDASTILDACNTYSLIVTNTKEYITKEATELLIKLKNEAIKTLDANVETLIEKIPYESVKSSLRMFYTNEKTKIENIDSIDDIDSCIDEIKEDLEKFAIDESKEIAIKALDNDIDSFIQKIPYDSIRIDVKTLYTSEKTKLNDIKSLEDINSYIKEIKTDIEKFALDECKKIAINTLDTYMETLISKIPYDLVKTDINTFYTSEKTKLNDIKSVEDIISYIDDIKANLEKFAIDECKKIAVAKLEELVSESIDKIANEELKNDLNEYAKEEINQINSVTSLDQVVPTLERVLSETKEHVSQLLKNTVRGYIARLAQAETATAYDYIPEAMSPKYQNNLVSQDSISYDFSNFTNISDLNKAGFGEQWEMVVENINQSVSMANVFNVGQTVFESAGNAINIYIENSYKDEMSYTFSGDGYNASFIYKDSRLILNISFTNSVSMPAIGDVKPVIRMEYDILADAKGMFISLGDSYKVKYVITPNAYEMATTYGLTLYGKSASRSSYLSISKENDKTTGHIYEYTTYEGSDKVKACADFYVEDGYVSVVGNKASGMTAFDGYINELYRADEGRMLGYEVREELTIAGITGTYNTLWFNLWDIDGISNVKVVDKTDSNKSSLSTVDVYLNNGSKLLSPTYNSKLTVKTSRKYDIEFRNRYYYTYDLESNTYVKNLVNIPMMFIQEGSNYNSFETDIKKDNSVEASVSLSSTYLNKILSDYDTLIDIFIVNKENMSSDEIIKYLEQYE